MHDDRPPPATYLVFALKPNAVLEEAILRAKSDVLHLAGPQVYLDHPPHLTLYVSAFAHADAAVRLAESIAGQWQPPRVRVLGWHTFGGDALTGGQTLVCDVDESDRRTLRGCQTQIIERLAPARDAAASEARYRPHFGSLSQDRQDAVRRCGFPFIGEDWVPHLTIASVEAARWGAVWEALRDRPISGEFTCDSLAVFELEDDHPRVRETFPLGG